MPCGLHVAPTGIIVLFVSGILCMVLVVVGLCFAMRACAQLRRALRWHGQGSTPADQDGDGDQAVTALPCHEHSPQHAETASQTSDQDETPAAASTPPALARLVVLLFCSASACIGLAAGLALAPMRFKG